MLMDEFLRLLRLNILKRVAEGEPKPKAKRWPNTLISSAVSFPNYPLYHFYQAMN